MAQTDARGTMDVRDQKQTFHGFLIATVWICGAAAQIIALLTLAFAIGAGFWPGFVAFVIIGIAIGMVFKLGGAYWASQVAFWVLLTLGGLIVPALAGMAG